MNPIYNMPFRKKLTVIGLIPLLLISILIGVLSYYRASQSAVEANKSSIVDSVNRIDISLTLRTRQLDKTVQTLAKGFDTDALLSGQEDCLAALLENMYLLEPFREVQSVSIFRDGAKVCHAGQASSVSADQAKFLCKSVKEDPSHVVWTRQLRGLHGDCLMIYTSLQDSEGNVQGLLVLELNDDVLGHAIFRKQKTTDRQINFMLDREKSLLYSDSPLPKGLVRQVLFRYQGGERTFQIRLGDNHYYCCAQYNGIVGWTTVAAVNISDLFPEGPALAGFITAVIFVSIFFSVLLLSYLSHLITRPLEKLDQAMEQIHDGNLDVHVENSRTDEIGHLTDTFNFMADNIRTLINEVYQQKLAQQTAEMQALQAQINPHFMYNSLDSINWMLIDRGEMDISRVVVALGKLMQYSMDTKTSLVPLREEYRNIRDYMVVQHNRLENQLDYVLDLPSELQEIIVPKLTLQPIVENAIKHGVLPSSHDCCVTVKTRRHKDMIHITVHDNGSGMDEETVARCLRALQGDTSGYKSIGLPNVARRLQLHYGGKCSFDIMSIPGSGTEISLMIPFIEEGDSADEHHHC